MTLAAVTVLKGAWRCGERRCGGLAPKLQSETHRVVERRKDRRQKRRQEFDAQTRLAELLATHLPDTVFWSGVESKPRSRLGGFLQRRRGIKAGLPDVLVVANGPAIFIELKSRRRVTSKAQREIRAQLLAAGAAWFLARTPRAALAALALANVPFKRPWTAPPLLQPWGGSTTNASSRHRGSSWSSVGRLCAGGASASGLAPLRPQRSATTALEH